MLRGHRAADRRAPRSLASPTPVRRRAGHAHPRPVPAGLPRLLGGGTRRRAAARTSPAATASRSSAGPRCAGSTASTRPAGSRSRTRPRSRSPRSRRSGGSRSRRWSSSRTSTPGSTTAGLVRALRELGQALKSSYTTVLVLAPVLQLPVELEKEISVLDVPLPTFAELAELLRDIVGVLRKAGRVDGGPQARGGRAADQGRPRAHPAGGRERLRQGHRRRRPARRHRHPAGDRREAPGHPQERAARVLPGGPLARRRRRAART